LKGFLIPRYIIGAMVPYILLSLLLLTAVLFVQQAPRLAAVLIYAGPPLLLLGGICAPHFPRVLIFSLPLAPPPRRPLRFPRAWAATAKSSPCAPRASARGP